MQSNSNLVCTLIGSVFRIDSLLGQVGQILALKWPKDYFNWWFLTVIWKNIHTIQFKLCVYTCCMSVHNWFAFGPCWPNFGPLVAKKLLKFGENGCFRPPPAKLSTQPNWFLVCTLIWWVFGNDSIFTRGQLWPSGIVIACVCLYVCVCVCLYVNHKFVRTITCRPWELQSPKLGQRCKTPWLRSLLFWGFIDLDLQGQIEFKGQNLPNFGLASLSAR